MATFSREESKSLFLPLAFRAYDTATNPDAWNSIGYAPIGQIAIDHRALKEALYETQLELEKSGHSFVDGGDSLEKFALSVEEDASRNGNYFGWVALNRSTRTVAVTFRGTQGFDEWLKDVFIAPVCYPYGEGDSGLVHAGFLMMYKFVRSSTIDLLKQAAVTAYDCLLICGHSLGAAVATVAAPDLFLAIAKHTKPVVRTFASPRPADLIYSKNLTRMGISVMTHRNRFDIVPTVPYPPFLHTDTVALIGGGEFLHPKVSHNLAESYKPGLEALISDDSKLGGQPKYPYIYSEIF